jgi:ferredoxin-NADP reductase
VTDEAVPHETLGAVCDVVVEDVKREAAEVVSLVLRRTDGTALPSWAPGAHVDVILPSGLVRQYSLCGDAGDSSTYRIAVLREANSRGGSEEVHRLTAGQALSIREPRNNFALTDAANYLFLAGGIGITPILPMLRDACQRGAQWRLVYGGRSRKSMAFLDEVLALSGGSVDVVCEDESGYPDFESEISKLGRGSAIYACGPLAMLTAVEQQCAQTGHDDVLHLERFTADSRLTSAYVSEQENEVFEVELARTGAVLHVGPSESLLHVIRTVVPSVLYSCEEGYCGTCETRVLSGVPDHRDEVLTDEERAAGKTMMICVGRSKTARIVLDI